VLTHERPDGVILATPNRLHVEQGLACVAAGVPALIEKPLADTIEDGERLCRSAERANVKLLTGHHRQHNPIMVKAAEIVRGGRLGRLVDVAQLGTGDDTFIWNPGDGSDVVDGGDGFDALQFNGANINENFDISANGSRASLTRNIGIVTMDVNGTETINLRALGGEDTITVDDLTGTDVSNVNIDLSGTNGLGDGSADTIIINATDGDDVVTVSSSNGVVTVHGLRGRRDDLQLRRRR
jgi:predicted dehydrogenase